MPLQPKHAITDRLTGASDSSQLHSAFRQHDHSFGSEHHWERAKAAAHSFKTIPGQNQMQLQASGHKNKTRCSCMLQDTQFLSLCKHHPEALVHAML